MPKKNPLGNSSVRGGVMRKTAKNKQLFEILDDIYAQWTLIDDNFYTGKPNRLNILESASKELEVLAIKMQEHIKSMRRNK